MSLRDSGHTPIRLHRIVNIDNAHWVALRSVAGKIWLLDSRDRRGARQMDDKDYEEYVKKRKGAYPILFAEDMSKTVGDSQASSSNESPVLPCR